VHDFPGFVVQNGNGQVSAVAVCLFSFAAAFGAAATKKKPAARPTVSALINFALANVECISFSHQMGRRESASEISISFHPQRKAH